MDIGRVGIWSGHLRRADEGTALAAARHIERLGFTTAWFPSGSPGQLERARTLLQGTGNLIVATGILNVYSESDPGRTAAAFHSLDLRHPDRLFLGIGIGHRESIDRDFPGQWDKPLATIGAYLDGLDGAANPVPLAKRALAALGPRMLELAGVRTAGALPYLTTPDHTRDARQKLGGAALLAPEQTVVLETDADHARAIGRAKVANYLKLNNYVNSFRRMGFGDEDFSDGGSDRLVDALFAWGDADTVLKRVEAHHDAGADHVCIQVIAADESAPPVVEWERLAAALR
jgi:probable F420-dependent oxidoreductase